MIIILFLHPFLFPAREYDFVRNSFQMNNVSQCKAGGYLNKNISTSKLSIQIAMATNYKINK